MARIATHVFAKQRGSFGTIPHPGLERDLPMGCGRIGGGGEILVYGAIERYVIVWTVDQKEAAGGGGKSAQAPRRLRVRGREALQLRRHARIVIIVTGAL